jgi:hypothetical protein
VASKEPGQKLKRILIYGACHAQVIRDLLSQILPRDDFEFVLLINFQLIASGQPFPYEDLRRYDAVIYSPIENHGGYNTEALREACAAIGCQAIVFPWLEWHGYFPAAQKGLFKGRHQWHYPQLQVLAESFDGFDRFYHHVVEHFPDDRTIDEVFETSSSMLRGAEARHDMPVRISAFIAGQFQFDRLFLIPDHPTLKIYEQIIRQILAALKLDTDFTLGGEEPQGELYTPIFPRVAQRLGLQFSGTNWIDRIVVPGMIADLRSYLRLYFYPDGVILAPLGEARIFAQGEPGASADLPAALDTRLFARPALQTGGGDFADYELLQVLDGPKIVPGSDKKFSINPNEWRSTWIY